MEEMNSLPLWVWILLFSLVIIQGTCLFLHARKHHRYAWFWGIWGLTTVPMPTILYICFVVKPWKRRQL